MIPDFVFLGVPILALIVAVYAIRRFTKQTNDVIDKAQKDHDEALAMQVRLLIESVSTKVTLCASREEVVREATMMVTRATKSYHDNLEGKHGKPPADAEPENEAPQPNPDYTKQDFIVIYGAAALGDDEEEVSKKYKQAIERAMAEGIRFRRYVGLIKVGEIEGRSETVRNGYCKWLCRQYDELLKSPEGFLIDNVRAPQWGSATSTMITNEGILEIKSGGSRALSFYNASQAASIRRSYRDELDAAQPNNKIEYSRSDKNTMESFHVMILGICAACNFDPAAVSDNFLKNGKP